MKDHKDYERSVQLVMSVMDELVNIYEFVDTPNARFTNTLSTNSFGRKNKDGSKRKEGINMTLSVTKPTRDEIENLVRSILLKYKMDVIYFYYKTYYKKIGKLSFRR